MHVVARSRTVNRWTLGAALFVGAFMLGLSAVADGDIWWHLAAGREMLRTRSLLQSDPFSLSAAGRPWVDVHWLFQLAVYGLYRLGGLSALVFAKSLVIASGATCLFAAVARGSSRRAEGLFVVAILLALFSVREQLQLRPVVVTLLFLAVFFVQLERFCARPEPSRLFLLPLVQVVWANTQGLFLLGPGLVAAYLLGVVSWSRWGKRSWFPFAPEVHRAEQAQRAARALLVALSCCSLACLFTPFGVDGLSLPSHLLGRLVPTGSNVFSANVAENVPPLASERLLPGQFFHLKWFFAALFAALIAPGRRLRSSHVLVLLSLVVLALIANRNLVLLYWLATPIAVMKLSPGLRWLTLLARKRRSAFALRALGYAAISIVLGLAGSAAARESALSAPAPFRVPSGSAQRIAAAGGQGTIFAADNYGGYLIWALFPEHRPYIDTRLILRTPGEYREYLRVVDEPSLFESFQRRHGFQYVVLPTAYPDRYLGLIAHLYRSPDWKLLYTDGTETLFVTRESSAEPARDLARRGTTEQILSEIEREYSASPTLRDAARIQFATLDSALAEFAEAEQALSGITRPEAQALRARCLLARGETQAAREISLELLKANASDVQSLNLLAVSSLERGEVPRAVELLKRALRVDPYDAEATQILASLEDQQHVETP